MYFNVYIIQSTSEPTAINNYYIRNSCTLKNIWG